MAGLLTRGLGWPVGFWSRYSPFGVLFCACIDGLTLWFWFFIFLIFHWFLHPFYSAFLSFVMTGHDLPGWGLYLPSGRSVRLGLLFPTHSRGVQVLFYHHSGLVASSAETCGFCSATGLLVWVWKRLIDFVSYCVSCVLGTLAKKEYSGMQAKHQRVNGV